MANSAADAKKSDRLPVHTTLILHKYDEGDSAKSGRTNSSTKKAYCGCQGYRCPRGSAIVGTSRAFARTKLARPCQQLGLHYAIGIKPQLHVEFGKLQGKPTCLPVKRGSQRRLKPPAETPSKTPGERSDLRQAKPSRPAWTGLLAEGTIQASRGVRGCDDRHGVVGRKN